MFVLLIHHPFIAFLIWSLFAFAFGLVVGKVIRYADAAEQPQQDDPDTAVLDWNKRPEAWL